jgi:hypothetical protein
VRTIVCPLLRLAARSCCALVVVPLSRISALLATPRYHAYADTVHNVHCACHNTGLCLKRVRDSLGMGAELYRALMMYYICGSCYFTLIALMDFGVLRFSSRIHFILVAGLSFMLLDTNWYSRRSWSNAVTELSSTTVGTTVGTTVDNSFTSSERPYSSALGKLRTDRLHNIFAQLVTASAEAAASLAGCRNRGWGRPDMTDYCLTGLRT